MEFTRNNGETVVAIVVDIDFEDEMCCLEYFGLAADGVAKLMRKPGVSLRTLGCMQQCRTLFQAGAWLAFQDSGPVLVLD